jgi:hypothetical protein
MGRLLDIMLERNVRPYAFEFKDEATAFVDGLGGNNWQSNTWWIYTGGDQPVLMGMLLQDCGFYVHSNLTSIREFVIAAGSKVTHATSHNDDDELFILWTESGEKLLVEKRVRNRVWPKGIDSDTTVALKADH